MKCPFYKKFPLFTVVVEDEYNRILLESKWRFSPNIFYYKFINNRFKRRLEKTYLNIWHFIDSIRKEIDTIHDIITEINIGMGPHTKRLKFRITEQRTKQLYDQFNNNQILVQELLHRLTFGKYDLKGV